MKPLLITGLALLCVLGAYAAKESSYDYSYYPYFAGVPQGDEEEQEDKRPWLLALLFVVFFLFRPGPYTQARKVIQVNGTSGSG